MRQIQLNADNTVRLITELPDVDDIDIVAARAFKGNPAIERVLSKLLPAPPPKEKKTFEHSYYPTGEIDTIVIKIFDLADVLLRSYTIKHYIDGRQPVKL